MRVDPASSLYKLVRGVVDSRLDELRSGFPCRVISFDESNHIADIQPLIKISTESPTMITGAPVLFQRFKVNGGTEMEYRPFLRPGDIVFAVCSDRELKNAQAGQVAEPDTSRKHSLNDAVILGVFGWSP